MTPMIPDCGVLSTPRRSPPIKLNVGTLNKSPILASVPFKTPPRSSEEVGVTLSTGFSFGFYKSPKLSVSPKRSVDPQPVVRRVISKHRTEAINKGVSHKIKKPKPKSKALKKKTRDVKTVLKRLKEGNFTPCPWIPSNRSPLRKTPKSDGKKKRHVLTSPGMSLLEDDVPENADVEGEEKNSKRFFTSRSRASATVNIGKNVLLSAKNGDITLKQKDREGAYLKKNIGRVLEHELGKFISECEISQSIPGPSTLPTVMANPRPMPTRVATTPSPPKRQPSPRKSKKLFTPTILDVGDNIQKGTSQRRSPRKLSSDRLSSPTRKSPRKSAPSPMTTPKRSVRSPTRSSPRKVLPAKRDLAKAASQESSLPTDTLSSESPKIYAVFDPLRRRADVSPAPKVEKQCSKHHGMQKSSSSQMVIDAGQKDYGARQCTECGIVYEIANSEDEASHEYHHNAVNNSLKFMGWKKEKVVTNLDELGGRIVMITSSDPQHCWRKVEDVVKVVDEELGFSENGIQVKETTQAFLYVLDRKVIGCLIGERISQANRVIPSVAQSQTDNRLLCCSKEQVTVWAGVSRLWVLNSHRGKGIATKLADAMRCNMFTNYVLSMSDIAFSDPTESGARFAERYTERRDFLVYRR